MDFRILGPLEVRANGERLALGGPKQRALLAILLLSADRVVSRDRLIEELWADDPPAAARHALEVNVSRLRKALGANGAGGSPLVTRAPGYVLARRARRARPVSASSGWSQDGRRAVEAGDPDARGAGAARGGGPVARAAAGRSGVRAVRARGRRAARGASPGRDRGAHRGRARARPPPSAGRGARGARRRASAARAAARAADAGAVSLRAPGGRARGLPRVRGRRSSSRSASSRGPSCARCTRRSCGRTRRSTRRSAARAAARSSRRSRR